MPPGFCANATSAGSASNSHPAAASTGRGRFMSIYLPLLVASVTSWIRAIRAAEPCYPRPVLLSPCSMCRFSGSLPYIDRRDRIAAGALHLPSPLTDFAIDQQPLCRTSGRACTCGERPTLCAQFAVSLIGVLRQVRTMLRFLSLATSVSPGHVPTTVCFAPRLRPGASTARPGTPGDVQWRPSP